MGFDFQKITNSSLGVNLAMFIGKTMPPWLGYPLAEFIGKKIADQPASKLVQRVRSNQWVVHDCNPDKQKLDQDVHEMFRISSRSIYDLYHYLNKPDAAGSMIEINNTVRELIQRREFEKRGMVLAGLHISNFDLCLQWLVQRGMKPLVLTIPEPQGGHRIEFETRKRSGLNIIPASVVALRQSLRHLQQGGLVLTGIDRPIENPEITPNFFNQPAALPTHHIFLALKAKVPIIVMAATLEPDGKYHIFTSDPIEMDSHPDRDHEMIQNAEKVLYIAEGFIRKAPEQWTISLPVWPGILDQDFLI